jgi:hypothetical protein
MCPLGPGIFDGNGEGCNDEDVVVDGRIDNTGSCDIYGYGFRRTALLGNTFGDAGSTQVRLYAPKTLIGHNVFEHYALQDYLKLLGTHVAHGKTRYSIISDNVFLAPPDHLQMVDIGPQNDRLDIGRGEYQGGYERIQDTIIERNIWNAGSGFDDGGVVSDQGDRITIRNNVFINLERGIMENDMVGEGWNSWWVYNNSFYNGTSPWNPRFVDFGPIRDLRVFDNICFITAASDIAYGMNLGDTSLSGIGENSNIWYLPNSPHHFIADVGGIDFDLPTWRSTTGQGWQSIAADPLFQDPNSGNLQLQAGSPALGTAVFTPYVREDINGSPRPLTGRDMGAYQQ